ncbi:FIG168882: metal-dependent phosphoesterases (PHP family) [hydrothermal vent metagenome]|uniref:FIG168882: metal-dependent phosphoesterases (PHP family) n=1 Tax=hydrothermal vent metagenome TaxID=652676 RepID=A0A3B1C7S2_9ZZZZ
MLRTYRADLHIHTCLSPCAELDMTPARVVSTAIEEGLDIIAVTDHNTAENIPSAIKANGEITVIPGMELTTAEEAHILALFPDMETVMRLQEIAYNDLPLTGNKRILYEQVVVNEKDEVLRFNDRVLMDATRLGVKEAINIIHGLGGITVACHIDREAFSILTQLGFIHDSLKFDALEISFRTDRKRALKMFGIYDRYPWITSSDAHHVSDIGRAATEFIMKEPSFDEIVLALSEKEGRKVRF